MAVQQVGNAAKLATYVVEKGRPLLNLAEGEGTQAKGEADHV